MDKKAFYGCEENRINLLLQIRTQFCCPKVDRPYTQILWQLFENGRFNFFSSIPLVHLLLATDQKWQSPPTQEIFVLFQGNLLRDFVKMERKVMQNQCIIANGLSKGTECPLFKCMSHFQGCD